MPTSTTNYGLIKPGTDDPILIGQINDNMDTVDTVLKDHSDKIDAAALGIKFKGEVNYYSNLPNDAEIGDAYTVKYAGSSGTTPDGTEYVWGAVSGVNQWINFSKDSYSKAEVDALLALKQNALSSTQLDAVNSGINSAKVEQIETNKNNISKQQDTTAQGGNGYAIINGKRLYMTDSEPATGRIGDIWLYGNNIYQYTAITNIANVSIEQGTFNADGGESPNNKRVRTTFDTNIYPKGAYTVTITGANNVLMFVYDSNKTCIQAEGSGGWNALPYSFELSGDRYVRFAFRKTNDGDISPSDVSNYALAFTGWYK